MDEKVRYIVLAFVLGILIGSGAGVGIVAAATARERAEYKSLVADRERQLTELNRQLAEARAFAGQRAELDRELMATIQQGMGAINQARSEYERALASVRLAQSIFEKLRPYYDSNYKPTGNTDKK
jgi:hypothetical protein